MMKIKGICKDCQHRWQLGRLGEPQHLYCNRAGGAHIVKNHNMKSCKYYQKATEELLKVLQKTAQRTRK